MRRDDKGLSETQLYAIRCMGRRQLAGFPETRFGMTNQDTYSEHPDCGGGTRLFINTNMAYSLVEMGLASMSSDKVWLSRTTMALLRAGDELKREW